MKLVSSIIIAALGLNAWAAQAQTDASNRFEFRTPHRIAYRLTRNDDLSRAASGERIEWLAARIDGNSTNRVELGSRVVLQLDSPDDLKQLTEGRPLELSRSIRSNLFILQAPDALTAVQEAHRLAAFPEVAASYPVLRRYDTQHGPYAVRSNDPFAVPFFYSLGGQYVEAQWPIENRDGNSIRLGVDLNIMAAWPYSLGESVTVAVADTGLEMNHPELTNQLAGAPHFNFVMQTTSNTGPIGVGSTWTHGTSVAGLIAAERNNGRTITQFGIPVTIGGMTGIAPKAHLASWQIYATNGSLASDEQLMGMYGYASGEVSVQNHSWGAGNGLTQQDGPSLLEQIGIENAVTLGRNGLGVVMVRSAGNDRGLVASPNDDGYPNSPYVITAAAVKQDGRATYYSEAGSCILLGAPGGGDPSNPGQGLFTLDLVGSDRGVNAGVTYLGDRADYRWGVQGFIGTSAAAPQVSGIVALMLSVNPGLGYRDIQQILALSARHWDLADPDLATNGAGFRVSHNVGFGVPDAGHAVWLARMWSNRPPLVTLAFTNSQLLAIPDNGLRVEVAGDDIAPGLASITAFPTFAPAPDDPTPALQLVDIGVATNVPAANLTNKAALILRDEAAFSTKISNAAAAGAEFAIIYNDTNSGGFNLGLISSTDYSPIPAVLIGNSGGEGLKATFATNSSARARLRLLNADKVFQVNSTLLCEHVGVHVQTDHPLRGDLRITVRSPRGTRSVLQHFNDDTNPGPTDWTYWTTHHFLESSLGDWTVSITDQFGGAVGSILEVRLILHGTQITDADHDGLADTWETNRLGSPAFGPKDDPDGDGFANAREQLMGTNPLASDLLATPNLSRWGLFGSEMMRLSWSSAPQYLYEIRRGSNVNDLNIVTNLAGGFPETELFVPFSPSQNGFFQVRAFQAP